MRIAIVSDLHLGYERFREDAFAQAKEALEQAYAVSDMIIMPGDIFNFRHPKPDVIAEAIGIFKELSEREYRASVCSFEGKGQCYTKKPIVVIPGTHERRSDTAVDPVDLLSLAGLVVNINKAKAVVEKDGERVSVFGIGGVAEERFRDTINEMAFVPDKDSFNIFMFHQSLYEILPFSKEFMHVEELPEGFDLYVDGHIHNKIELKCHGKPFLIPGSTVLTQLKDGEQEQKGFFVFDTRKKSYEFVGIRSRRFVVLKLDVNGVEPSKVREHIEGSIGDAISGCRPGERPVIRVELKGKVKEGFRASDLDIAGIASSHSDAIVEIARGNVEDTGSEKEISELQKGMLESVSVKDYGMGIFLEKLKSGGYSLKVSPSRLFELLSSEGKKDVIMGKALEELFS